MPIPRELSESEYLNTFSPPMVDVTESAEELVDLWAYADPIFEELYSDHPDWESYVQFIYESGNGLYQHINIPVPKDDTYLVVIVDKPNKAIVGHKILDLRARYSIAPRDGV